MPPLTEKQLAGIAKRKAAQALAHTCRRCGRRADYPKSGGGTCRRCAVALWAKVVLDQNPLFLDTETTGLGYDADVIQVAVMDSAGALLMKTYVKPTQPIDERAYGDDVDWEGNPRPTAYGVNGISNAMVADAPTFPEVWEQLRPLLTGRCIVAYNVEFDREMLCDNAERHDLEPIPWQAWECAMLAFAEWFGEPHKRGGYRWQTLWTAVNSLAVNAGAAHEAAGDCGRTLGVMRALAAYMPEKESGSDE